MRLLLFGPGHPFRGGIASTTTSLALALQKRGQELLFLGPERQYPALLYPGGRDRDPGACPRVPCAERLYSPLEPWTWMRAVERAVAFSADAWLFPYWTWAWAPFFRLLRRAAGDLPLVSIVHNPADHGGGVLQRLAARLVLEHCDGFFTHALGISRLLEREYPGRKTAVHLLPPPPLPEKVPDRTEKRRELGIREDELLALFFGLIRPYKGVDLLIEAFGLPGFSKWRLLVAGEAWGGEGTRLRKLKETPGLEGRVRLDLRWQSEEEVEALLAAADLVVLPYRSSSQSAVAPLALSRGVPVLSTRAGGLEELIRDGVNGRLVDPVSAEALADGLRSIGAREIEKLGRGALSSVGELSWDSYAAKLENLLAEVGAG